MTLPLIESFDRYGRYRDTAEVRRVAFGPDRIRVLDVGDPSGTMASLFLTDDTVSVDLQLERRRDVGGHQQALASGLSLPFADASFDLVTTHDTIEHLAPSDRIAFLDELLRVGRGPVVVSAPFADPRTVRCEQLVNAYYVARVGHSLAPLDEHAANGLPDLVEVVAALDQRGVAVATYGSGWLYHWVAFMLLKGHLVSEGDGELERRVDAAVNERLGEVDRRAPHYRRVVVLRPGASYDLPPSPAPGIDDPSADVDALVRLGLELEEALPRGEDPAAPGSPLRGWIAAHAADDGPVGETARSLSTALDAAQRPTTATVPTAVDRPPPAARRVAVIVVNLNGAEHLVACLDSLAEQDYARELTEVIVVDNGSTDGSLELLAERYRWVTVLAQTHNLGFAPAVNVGAKAAIGAECVVFINNDMRAERDWLTELVRAYDPDAGVVCVGAQILSWDGLRLDFGEGVVSFYGMGNQIGFGRALGSVDVRDQRELLFACGGSMLVSRDLYLKSGGFDDQFFAYFEDVDFGWRLWVLGYRVLLAANARCYHRMHGTSSRFAQHQRLLLYERNALRCITKNYDDAHLREVLGPSLLLLAKRAVVRGQLDRSPYELGGDGAETEEVSRVALAHLHAVVDVIDGLPALMDERRRIQLARQRSDDEIIERFGRPLQPVDPHPDYVQAQHDVVTAFGLDRLFDRQRARQVLVISSDEIGEKMRGPAIRAWEIARALARTVEVAVAVPGDAGKPLEGVPTVGYQDEATLLRLAESADVLLIQGYTLRRHPALARTAAVMVVDLYDPWLFENLELHHGSIDADRALAQDVGVLNELLDHGDFFICASERQRDYWLGMLSARGLIDASTYAVDPSLRQLIDVVPFGLPDRAPRHAERVLKGVHPAVGADDPVVLWGGGTWDWFDPITVIEAFHLVVERIPNARLYFLGLQLESPDVVPMKMADAAVRRAEELGLAGTSVIFGDWAPYELREAYLLEADVAVSAARDLAETRLAFRSRVLDYLWAGLPVVTTAGDVLSDLVQEERLGTVVAPGDPAVMATALLQLLEDPVRRAECAERARAVAERFRWERTVEPLRRVVLAPWKWRVARQLRPRGRALTEDAYLVLQARDRELEARDRVIAEREQVIAHHRDEAAGYAEEVVQLRARADQLEAIVAHKDRPYAFLRRTPLYRLARWLRSAAGGRG